MNTSQFMDKQIMDLSNSQTHNPNDDFIDLNNPRDDHHHIGNSDKKEEILPSYDFQPIRPVGTSSPPSKIGSASFDAPRAWNSADNKTNISGVRTYSSFDSLEPGRVILDKDQNAVDPNLVSEIDRTMKKYADNLMHGLDGVSARLTQLESRTRHLENSLDELKVSFGTNHGSSDGRMRQLENILREVQNGVQFIKDKQEIMDAQLQLSKLQVSKVELHADTQSTEHVDTTQPALSVSQQSHQHLPPVALPPPAVPPPNAPPPHSSQQNLPPQVQLPNQYSHSQLPSVPQRDPYFAPPPPGQTPENLAQQYQMPPSQQLQASSPPQPQQQYQPLPQPQYSQAPAPPQPHTSLPAANSPHAQPPLAHHPEESSYVPSQSYPPTIRHSSLPPSAAPPHQQFYGAGPNMYEPPSSRPGPGFSGTFSSSGSGEQYSYSNPSSHYGSGMQTKPQQLSSPTVSHGGGSGYPQLPTARILPHAIPTASSVSSGSGSAGSGNRVPIDDVVDKVTNMGFPRDQVRATVRKLTENGQAVDLNAVLDKLMNDGEVQPPRGWFGR